MEDSGKHSNSKFLNPWMLQFQKMGLELKCPLCLNLFRRPMLLPCNHIFCNSCIADCSTLGSECAVCNIQYAQRDLRHLPFVENMVAIYKSLDAAFCANLFQQRSSDDVTVMERGQPFLNSTFSNKMTEEPFKTSLGDNLHSEQSIFSQTTKVHVTVPSGLYHSMEVGIGKNQKYDGSGKAEEFDISQKKGVDFASSGKPNLVKCFQLDGRSHQECGVVEMDMNQVTQSSPGSPPFCDTKGSDNDCSDQDSEHLLPSGRLESTSLKRGGKENVVFEKRTQLRSESSASETEGLMRELKRQKNDDIQPSVTHKPVASSCNLDHDSGMEPDSSTNTGICSFCQSSKISEDTGPMLHYKDGNSVTGDAAHLPSVVHVHRMCIDWAPQVYFVDEVVKNLEPEVARGAKLKCSKCGLKGAALGCFVRSCRKTYHVPCAMDIPACRWDEEDFLLLCPIHSHVKFPCEKSKSRKRACQKQPVSTHSGSQQSNGPVASLNSGKHLVFCGSALSTGEKIHLINFASRIGATVTKFWTPDVTHVIAATDADGACTRTLKVLMAILKGQWVLKMDWVNASMEVMHPVEEEPYEISLDNHGRQGGPKAGRLRALTNGSKLFSGLNLYFSGDYMPDYKKDLVDLVVAGGGTVLESKEELEAESKKCETCSNLIVYNLDPPRGSRLGDEVTILWERLNEAEDLAATTGSRVIGHTWILESISGCKLQPFIS